MPRSALLEPGNALRDQLDAGDVHGRIGVSTRSARPGPSAAFILRLSTSRASLFALGLQLLDRVDGVFGCRGERADHAGECGAVLLRPRDSTGAGQCLDSTHPGGDAALLDNREEADVAGGAHVCAAAQLGAESVDRDNAHLVSVFLAKESHRAAGNRFFRRADLGLDRGVPVYLSLTIRSMSSSCARGMGAK